MPRWNAAIEIPDWEWEDAEGPKFTSSTSGFSCPDHGWQPRALSFDDGSRTVRLCPKCLSARLCLICPHEEG